MPKMKVTVTADIDGQVVAGTPYSKVVDIDESQSFSYVIQAHFQLFRLTS